jgi:hypothetical protein
VKLPTPIKPARQPPEEVATAQGADAEDKEEETPSENEGERAGSRLAGVLGGLGALLVLAFFILLISGKWVDLIWHPLQRALEDQGIPPVVAVCVTAALFLIPLTLYSASSTKSAFLNNIPGDLDFRPARRADFPELDERRLQAYTEAFESLGFERLLDYTTVTDTGGENKGFARLLVHPEEHCFAEINQVFSAGTATPMRCNITSELEEGWSLATGDRQPNKHSYVMRRRRGVWQSRVGEEVEAVFAAHLTLRKRMTRDLGVDVVPDTTAEAYFAHERRHNAERKQAVRRRNGLMILLEMWLFDRNPKHEWLGDYARKARA